MSDVIVTFTANPSLDRTALLAGPLETSVVNHVVSSSAHPGGRGVQLSGTVHRAGRPTLAIFPAASNDPLVAAVRATGIPFRTIPIGHLARTNFTMVTSGLSTLIREPGHPLAPESVTAMVSTIMASSPGADWLALCGSLPPGSPADLYVRMGRAAHGVGVKVAVQTSGGSLDSVVSHADTDAPDLLTMNMRQFAEVTGIDLTGLDGDDRVTTAARHIHALTDAGLPRVLVTLAADGALLATPHGRWYARSEVTATVTAIGRGAAAMGGYLMAEIDGAAEPERLRQALAYATARSGKTGSEAPSPADAAAIDVLVSELPS
ncbi:1-phosphofructokinase family hexose kinase [Propioniciclava soli]|uniref:PfkB family carbohydrate kinase n=1 Tax=Propioniciclava soli TaxID=2775081 RepID=A0ABZ3CAQ6_9ACTN